MEITSAGMAGLFSVGVLVVLYGIVVRRLSVWAAIGSAALVAIWLAVWLWLQS